MKHDVKDSVVHFRQGRVEVLLLESPVSTTQSAVALVVFLEVRVSLDCVEGWPPFGLPILGDMKYILDEDLVINENSMAKVFADVFLVPLAIAFLVFLAIVFIVVLAIVFISWVHT